MIATPLHDVWHAGEEEIRLFSELSGDRNPLHLDPLFARTAITGFQTFFGVGLVLGALECLARTGLRFELGRVRASFLKPVQVGSEVAVAVRPEADALGLEIACGRETVVTGTLELAPAEGTPDCITPGAENEARRSRDAAVLAADDVAVGDAGSFAPHRDALALSALSLLYPSLARACSNETLLRLAALSRLVGMVCPGRLGFFLGFDARFGSEPPSAPPDGSLHHRVTSYRKLLGHVTMQAECAGGSGRRMKAAVEALFTRPPKPPATLDELLAELPDARIDGLRVLVTGGSRGLGAALVRRLAARGAAVAFSYRVGRQESESILDELRARGIQAYAYSSDARNPGDAAQLVSEVTRRLGGLDVALHAATGTLRPRSFAHTSAEDVEHTIRTHLFGAFHLAQAALPALRDSRGTLVFISSEYMANPVPEMAHYMASKSAVEGLARGLACDEGSAFATVIARCSRFESDQTRHALIPEPLPSADDVARGFLLRLATGRPRSGVTTWELP